MPLPVLVILRGIGQVFFQENALSGALFVLGIALAAPVLALGGIVGSALGMMTAQLLKLDKAEIDAGIYGFNATLVGIATFFFFDPGVASIALLIVGCLTATGLTWLMRKHVPFPTYTTPFIVTTWVLYFVGPSLGATRVEPSDWLLVPNPQVGFGLEAAMHGIGQVMFQASLWTGLLFLAGIAINDREHALWVLVGSILGLLVASYHVTTGADSIDPERLIPRTQFENIRLGLYGYNATLAPIALYLWRRSLIGPLLGILLTVPLTELIPLFGLPALTAPFVLATWLVLGCKWIEGRVFKA